jgi:hypothetical protein
MTHPDLNPEHQAVSDAARARVMELIGTITIPPEVVESVSEIPVLDLRF